MRILEIERLHCIVMSASVRIFTNMQILIYLTFSCYGLGRIANEYIDKSIRLSLFLCKDVMKNVI